MDIERQRERWRNLDRERRQSMTTSERQAYLTRRRANYRTRMLRSEMESSVGEDDQPINTQPEMIRPEVEGRAFRAVNYTVTRVGVPRMRLTHFRQMARLRGSENSNSNCGENSAQSMDVQPTIVAGNSSAQVVRINITNERRQMGRASESRHRLNSRTNRNRARYYNENMGVLDFHLPMPSTCSYYTARLFRHETSSICCSNGKIMLPQMATLPEMLSIFCAQDSEGRHFRQNIRAYNHVFSFTSMGVHVDENLSARSNGIYTFRAQGSIYHKIGSLLPAENNRPRFLQIYIYDTEHEIDNRMLENEGLHQNIVEKIQRILNRYNPFVHIFRQLAQHQDMQNCQLIIKGQPSGGRHQGRYSLPTASQVAAIIIGGDEPELSGRDITVQTTGGHLMNIHDCAGYYDPLQYPLLLPFGTYGWDENSCCHNGQRVTCREYYAYMLQIRENDSSLLLRGGRLLQQYVIDNYVKIETQRLRWMRLNQPLIRAELYQGLRDSLNAGVNNADNVGRRTILPSTFLGSPRDMYQRYQDAMALVQKFGKPDLFLTMTCNPAWDEIANELLPGQTPQDRPDLLIRVFHSKFEELKDDILRKGVLGRVVAYVYVIEFQKRGLPHVHMLLMLDEEDKIDSPEDYDGIVRAEIPNKEEEPQLYSAVLRHMIHGPCGSHNLNAPCMKDKRCKKNFPKMFAPVTTQGNDSYPIYQRREGPPVPLEHNENVLVDNRWVIPYNPWLLLKYNCHINVEICCSIKSVKYLYKYVYKGPDRVGLEVRAGPINDEIQHFVDARWICAPEALWRTFKFSMNQIYPSVERLQIHLPNMHQVRFHSDQTVVDVLSNENNSKTMLTEFFTKNTFDLEARRFLYCEFPEHYIWNNTQKLWIRRRSNKRVIGRIYTVSPFEGEKFYLRVLLYHVRGSMSFEDLLTVNGITYTTFKQAAEKRGLLEDDESIRQCLLEASNIRMPSALRRLFVTILVYCEVIGVRSLWDEFYPFMIEDYPSSSSLSSNFLTNRLLRDLRDLLRQHNKNISQYDLPMMTFEFGDPGEVSTLIQDEISMVIPQEDFDAIESLNVDQKYAFDSIMNTIGHREGSIFFVDGPGGTGKTYLYRALLANLRKDGHIVIATATSGIAATMLPGGRTAHSRFKIPLNPDASSTCSISKQSDLAELIRKTSAIIWDEAPMAHRYAFEALDRTFKDITNVDLPFGGKVMVFGGDFRQVLPVVPKATKSQMIGATVVKSSFWRHAKILNLKQNMRAKTDQQFSEFLLRVGDGEEPMMAEDMIKLPSSMIIPWEDNQCIEQLIDSVFPNLSDHVTDSSYMVERAIITPLNEDVDKLNEKIIGMFPGSEETLYSFDSVEDDPRNLYQQEVLNCISPGGFPPHKLTLKKGAPIMLLRNIDPKIGLCNGTRLLCLGCYNNVIDAEILCGQFAGARVFLPRIPLKTADNSGLPFIMTRKQFPVKLSFALTINKSQGQTIPHVGIYLPDHVFGHGQLYVALSRGVSSATTKVLVKKGSIDGADGVFTRNVVFKEVLLPPN